MSATIDKSAGTTANNVKHSKMRRIVFARVFGTALETYDLYLYGTAAALIFGPLFFPAHDPAVSSLLALATFAISFVARPVGSLVLGHFGDRLGRKRMLFFTLLLMGLSTTGIGALPAYAAIGLWAPLLLCLLRFLQGFAFAGEYTGSVLMLMEHAPPERRGFYAGINNVGPVFGFLLSGGGFLLVANSMSEAAFVAWGWRIPFLASFVLVLIGLYVRMSVPESPVFETVVERGAIVHEPKKLPFLQVFAKYPKELLLAAGVNISPFATFYIFSVFSLSYAKKTLGLSNGVVLSIAMLAMCTHLIAIPYAAARSDRVGRKNALITGLILTVLFIFPFWALLNTGVYPLMLLGSCLLMVAYAFTFAPLPSYSGELFGADVRFTGSAIAYNAGGIIGGGFAPIVASLLLDKFHSPYPIAAYIGALALISIGCVILSEETQKRSLLDRRTSD